jgi:hypothetical protein
LIAALTTAISNFKCCRITGAMVHSGILGGRRPTRTLCARITCSPLPHPPQYTSNMPLNAGAHSEIFSLEISKTQALMLASLPRDFRMRWSVVLLAAGLSRRLASYANFSMRCSVVCACCLDSHSQLHLHSHPHLHLHSAGANFGLNGNCRVDGKQRKKMNENETGNGECEHAKEEVKARRSRDAAALERTRSPLSNVAVEKVKVRFLRNISTEYSSNVPNLHRPA